MPMSTCGGCGKIFSSFGLFERHRVGNFEEPIYGPRAVGKSLKVIGYTAPNRRCMTTDELQQAGCTFERRIIDVTHGGQTGREEHDVWYDPAAREKVRAAFGRKSSNDE